MNFETSHLWQILGFVSNSQFLNFYYEITDMKKVFIVEYDGCDFVAFVRFWLTRTEKIKSGYIWKTTTYNFETQYSDKTVDLSKEVCSQITIKVNQENALSLFF